MVIRSGNNCQESHLETIKITKVEMSIFYEFGFGIRPLKQRVWGRVPPVQWSLASVIELAPVMRRHQSDKPFTSCYLQAFKLQVLFSHTPSPRHSTSYAT